MATVGAPHLKQPRAVAVQFRYAFVSDSEGLKVLDVTDPGKPAARARTRWCRWPTRTALYLARTYAYVAAGREGLVIVDIERPGDADARPGATTPAARSTTRTT